MTTCTTYTITEELACEVKRPVVTEHRPLSNDECLWMKVWKDDFIDKNGGYVMASGEVVTWDSINPAPFVDAGYSIGQVLDFAVVIFRPNGSVTEYATDHLPIDCMETE